MDENLEAAEILQKSINLKFCEVLKSLVNIADENGDPLELNSEFLESASHDDLDLIGQNAIGRIGEMNSTIEELRAYFEKTEQEKDSLSNVIKSIYTGLEKSREILEIEDPIWGAETGIEPPIAPSFEWDRINTKVALSQMSITLIHHNNVMQRKLEHLATAATIQDPETRSSEDMTATIHNINQATTTEKKKEPESFLDQISGGGLSLKGEKPKKVAPVELEDEDDEIDEIYENPADERAQEYRDKANLKYNEFYVNVDGGEPYIVCSTRSRKYLTCNFQKNPKPEHWKKTSKFEKAHWFTSYKDATKVLKKIDKKLAKHLEIRKVRLIAPDE